MPISSDQAKANILAAVGSDDPIGALLPTNTNDFRLKLREQLQANRSSRFGSRFAMGSGGGSGVPQPSTGGGIAGTPRPPSGVPGDSPGGRAPSGGGFLQPPVSGGGFAGGAMFGPGTFGGGSISGPGVTTRGAGERPTSSSRDANSAAPPPHDGAGEFLDEETLLDRILKALRKEKDKKKDDEDES